MPAPTPYLTIFRKNQKIQEHTHLLIKKYGPSKTKPLTQLSRTLLDMFLDHVRVVDMDFAHYLAHPVSLATLPDSPDRPHDQDTEVVAVVDDSKMSRTFHCACLEKEGFRCVQIAPTDLLATILAIEASQPDLLLVDFLMPNFRGDALIRALRGRDSLRDVPVLVVTAYRGDELINQLLRMDGVKAAFTPISAEDLLVHVRAALESE